MMLMVFEVNGSVKALAITIETTSEVIDLSCNGILELARPACALSFKIPSS